MLTRDSNNTIIWKVGAVYYQSVKRRKDIGGHASYRRPHLVMVNNNSPRAVTAADGTNPVVAIAHISRLASARNKLCRTTVILPTGDGREGRGGAPGHAGAEEQCFGTVSRGPAPYAAAGFDLDDNKPQSHAKSTRPPATNPAGLSDHPDSGRPNERAVVAAAAAGSVALCALSPRTPDGRQYDMG